MLLNEARDVLSMMYGSPLAIVSGCLRGFLKAAVGFKLIVCDFSSIEARVLLWLAKGNLKIFTESGPYDAYQRQASEMYGKALDKITTDDRADGKVVILACGYQGGFRAVRKMSKSVGKKFTEEKEKQLVELWRQANPEVVAFWKQIERAAIMACKQVPKLVDGKEQMQMVACGDYLAFKRVGSHLLCRLPSGRVLTYPFARVVRKTVRIEGHKPFDTDELRYSCQNEKSQWVETGTYGGCLTENVVQAIARDLLTEAMLRVEDVGLPVVIHVHDEIGVEVPTESPWTVKMVEDLMSVVPTWAGGLPLEAKGWEGIRYGK